MGWGRVMVLKPTFNNISVILWRSIRKPAYPEKTANLPNVTDKLNSIML